MYGGTRYVTCVSLQPSHRRCHLGGQVLGDVGGKTAQFLLYAGQDGVDGILHLASLPMPVTVNGGRVLLDLVGDGYDEGEGLRDQQQFQNLETAHQSRPEQRKERGKTPEKNENTDCLLYTSPSPRDGLLSRMPSSA